MIGLLCALSLVTAAPGAFADGTWLPTRGGGGERLISALAGGGDGALYAAGAGVVYRLVPGQDWRPLGLYAPRLRYVDDEGIEAEGPFDPRFLDQVEYDVRISIENTSGMALEDELLTEDIVRGLLIAYIEEPDPDEDSPYFVARVVPSTRGVWLATGSGLFWADAKGVTGPIGDLTGVRDIAATPRGLAAVTDTGLFRVEPTGRSSLWVQRKITGVTTVGGQVAFIADGNLYLEGSDGKTRSLKPPTGDPKHIAGDESTLWVATPLALFRWENDQWTLCLAPPVPAQRLVAGSDSLAVLTESAIYVTDDACQTLSGIDPPWLGPLQFTDAALFAGSLWAASTEGVFALGPKDAAAEQGLQIEAFRRAVGRLPTFETTYAAALDYQNMDRIKNSFGYRPVLAGLLPTLRGQVRTWPQRREIDPTLTIGNDRLDLDQPEVEWQIMLEWKIRFDILGALFDAGGTDGNLEEVEVEFDEFDGIDEFDGVDEGDSVIVEVDGETPIDTDVAADVAYSRQLAERRQLAKDQNKLYRDLRTLYRERLRAMQQMWRGSGDGVQVTTVLRIDEIDAQIDALTGGAFSRQLGADAPVGKEGQ